MNYPIKFRVFRLDKHSYYADGVLLEDYIIEELHRGYIVTDAQNFEIDFVRTISNYAPEKAQKIIEAGGVASDLVYRDDDELENV